MRILRNVSAVILFVVLLGVPRPGEAGCSPPPDEQWCAYWSVFLECSYWGATCYSPTNDCGTAPCDDYASLCQMSATCEYDVCGYSWCLFEGPKTLGG